MQQMFLKEGFIMLTIVIVFYGIDLEKSISLSTLMKNIKKVTSASGINVILYDNNKESSQNYFNILASNVELDLCYKHNPDNPGIAEAYNFAFEKAKTLNSEWLMLLDQDTHLTSEYLTEVVSKIKNNNLSEAAIVPQIKDPVTHHLISPVLKDTKETVFPGTHKNLMAINSGMVVSTKFLEQINGFNLDYPLDYLDHWFFQMIKEKNQSVNVLKSGLLHDLSVKNLKKVSNQRYENVLFYEKKFIIEFQPDQLRHYYLHSMLRLAKCLLVSPSKIKIILKIMLKDVT
ncbi:glycosyltransferase [Vagococcus elongatus]|uniref:Glycosyltransferase 2-like domain-containing protein n=1 Tax=Vagococcus elongatus TaxID=180344 RepID=A0A430B434_9ENTE|nr:glycosyltransferase [Vagococcus elongatus]RSU15073.1 hypothetical protein CBF29_01675 [Vagococcus elongatus]